MFVPINTAQRLGARLRAAIDALQAADHALAELKPIMDAQVNGADFSQLETQFGLTPGQGQTAYNLVAGTLGDLAASANFTQLISWMG